MDLRRYRPENGYMVEDDFGGYVYGNDAVKIFQELIEILSEHIECNPAFRTKGIGAPNSPARLEQTRQINSEDRAKQAIAKYTGKKHD